MGVFKSVDWRRVLKKIGRAFEALVLSMSFMDYQVKGVSTGKFSAIALFVLLVFVSYFSIFSLSLRFTSNWTVRQVVAYLMTVGIVLLVHALRRGRKKRR